MFRSSIRKNKLNPNWKGFIKIFPAAILQEISYVSAKSMWKGLNGISEVDIIDEKFN